MVVERDRVIGNKNQALYEARLVQLIYAVVTGSNAESKQSLLVSRSASEGSGPIDFWQPLVAKLKTQLCLSIPDDEQPSNHTNMDVKWLNKIFGPRYLNWIIDTATLTHARTNVRKRTSFSVSVFIVSVIFFISFSHSLDDISKLIPVSFRHRALEVPGNWLPRTYTSCLEKQSTYTVQSLTLSP